MSERFLGIFVALLLWPICLVAQEGVPFGALARVLPEDSHVTQSWGGDVTLTLALSGGVPWRVRTIANPDRVVVDFRKVGFRGLDLKAMAEVSALTEISAGPLRAGLSRMVLHLAQPMAVTQAEMQIAPDVTEGATRLTLRLSKSDRATFDATAAAPAEVQVATEGPRVAPRPLIPSGDITVMIDPGHGGIDPGALRGDTREADLVLSLALELEEALLRVDGFSPVLTRRDDSFVSLERRVAMAAEAGAHVFVSLHADAIKTGRAQGVSVFTLSRSASSAAGQALVERHERGALLAGVDLRGADDEVAQVLIDLARQDNGPRALALAQAVVDGIAAQGAPLYKRPMQSAGFSVLKSAEIPSILIEAGFLSTEADLARLADPKQRAAVVQGIRDGLMLWVQEDRALAPLRRQ